MTKNLWESKKTLMYIGVGGFFLAAIFLFFITLLSMREIDIFKGSYNITVKFEFAEGLREVSPVRFCGVDVGQVRGITVREEEDKPLVYVTAKIEKGVLIPKDSYFFVNSLSLFGEKYLEINPPDVVTDYIKEGEIVDGISPIPLFNVFASFNKTMNEISAFVREGKIKTSFENLLLNMEAASLDVKELLHDMRDKQGTVGRLLYDDSLYETTEEFLKDLKANPWKLLHKPKEKKSK
tara:strand:+ start:280 stop:990 length:711 start_codon:yes stop_codon:yes gene_type:complete